MNTIFTNVLSKSGLNKKCYVLVFFLLGFVAEFSTADPFEKPDYLAPEVLLPSVAGLGGVYSTYQRDVNILFSNPALYPFAQKKVTILALNFRVDLLALQAVSQLGSQDVNNKMLNLLSKTKTLATNVAVGGPIYFAFVDKNFALGVFNTTKASLFFPSFSHIRALAGEDIYIAGGYGGTVYQDDNHTLSFGFNMKGFVQTYAYVGGSVFNAVLAFSEKQLDALPIVLQGGFGLDTGFIYRYADSVTLGVTLKDVYTPVFSSYYENYQDFLDNKKTGSSSYRAFLPNLTVGCSVEAFPVDYFKHIHSLTFYFDWKDFFSFIPAIRRNYLLNFAAGGELVLHRILSLRFGICDLYPQVGIGLDFTYFTLDLSLYTRELSLTPWKQPLTNIELGMRFDI